MYVRANRLFIHRLCKSFAAGDKMSGSILLDIFGPVINNLLSIVIHRNTAPKGHPYNYFYKACKKYSTQSNAETTRYVSMVTKYYDISDIKNEMYVVALRAFRLAAEKDEIVCSYILTTIAYNFASSIKKMINLVQPSKQCILYGDMLACVDKDPAANSPLDELLISIESLSPDNKLFMSGTFSCLTPVEIKILIMKYIYHMSDTEIGNEIMMNRTTVLLRRNGALEKIGYKFCGASLCKCCGNVISIRKNRGPGRPPVYCAQCIKERNSNISKPI